MPRRSVESFVDVYGTALSAGDLDQVADSWEIPSIVALDVRWPSFDDQGKARSVEMSHYLLRIGGDGKPRIQVALTRSVG